MKTITIRLPCVEAALLVEVQKVNKAYRDLQGLLISQIQAKESLDKRGLSGCSEQVELVWP